MGGHGSGRKSCGNGKNLVENCRQIDVRTFYRAKLFHDSGPKVWSWRDSEGFQTASIALSCNEQVLEFSYTIGSVPLRDSVPIEWTSCNYGGQRPWFRCPSPNCGRRVAKLYLAEKYFLCRGCNRLSYQSQMESRIFSGLNKMQEIRIKLGGNPSILYEFPSKPKGMHWKTYRQLRDKAWDSYHTSLMSVLSGEQKVIGSESGSTGLSSPPAKRDAH